MITIRAWDDFSDPYSNQKVETGTIHWTSGLSSFSMGVVQDEPTAEGDLCEPHQTVGWVTTGDAGIGHSGRSMAIAVPSYGRIAKLLVADGETVRPNQPL